MSALKQLFDTFHAAILDNDASAFVPGIRANARITPKAQMDIYVEGYRLRLQEAIASDYPEMQKLIGQQQFNSLASKYIEENPPSHYSLDWYPLPFAAFLRQQPVDHFAADLALLESAIAEVFVLPESAPLDAAALQSLTPESFGELRLLPRIASKLLALEYPAEAYLQQARQEAQPQCPEPHASYLFVLRHNHEVKRHALGEAEFLVLSELARGLPVGEALEAAAEARPELVPDIAAHVQSWFGNWVSHGFFQKGDPS